MRADGTASQVEVVIVGAGQAGLAASRCLTERGIEHVVLERGRTVERWRSERWDSLRLLSPNWCTRLPVWHSIRIREWSSVVDWRVIIPARAAAGSPWGWI